MEKEEIEYIIEKYIEPLKNDIRDLKEEIIKLRNKDKSYETKSPYDLSANHFKRK